jgi:O-antigen ligase
MRRPPPQILIISIFLLIGLIYACLCLAAVLRLRLGLQLLIIGLAIIQPFPTEEAPWDLYAYFGLGTILVAAWFLRQALSKRLQFWKCDIFSSQLSKSIMLFLIVCIASFPLSFLNNWEQRIGDRFYLYIRGLLPFTYLMLFFIVRDLDLTRKSLKLFVLLIFAVCATFGFRAYWLYFTTFVRITNIDYRFIFPFPVLAANMACAYFLFSRTALAAGFWAVVFLFFAGSVIPTYTKAQVLCLATGVLLITMIGYARGGLRLAVRVAGLIVLVAVLVAWAILKSSSVPIVVVSTWQARLEDETSYEGRSDEIQVALRNFRDNPLFGKGLGFQYTRSMDLGSGETVGYVHNIIAYLLMTLGAVGLVMYLRIFWVWLKMVRKTFNAKLEGMESMLAGIHASICSLFVYSFMYATVRTIQHNVLLAIGLALACGILRVRERIGQAVNEA